MNVALFIELVAKVGVPAAEWAYSLYINRGEAKMSPEVLETLRELSTYTSHDALAKAGIEIKNGQVVRL